MRQVTLRRLGQTMIHSDFDLVRKLVGDEAAIQQGPHGEITVTGLTQEESESLVEFGKTLNFDARSVIG